MNRHNFAHMEWEIRAIQKKTIDHLYQIRTWKDLNYIIIR